MEGLRKKRKMIDEEDEDVKMETFFALIRNVKDIRDRLLWLNGSNDRPPTTTTITTTATATKTTDTVRVPKMAEDNTEKEIRNGGNKMWQPSFKPEDFGIKTNGHVDDKIGNGDERGVSNKKQDGDNRNVDKSNNKDTANNRLVLDLNLSL